MLKPFYYLLLMGWANTKDAPPYYFALVSLFFFFFV